MKPTSLISHARRIMNQAGPRGRTNGDTQVQLSHCATLFCAAQNCNPTPDLSRRTLAIVLRNCNLCGVKTHLMFITDCQKGHDLKTCRKKQQADPLKLPLQGGFAVMLTDSHRLTGAQCCSHCVSTKCLTDRGYKSPLQL